MYKSIVVFNKLKLLLENISKSNMQNQSITKINISFKLTFWLLEIYEICIENTPSISYL